MKIRSKSLAAALFAVSILPLSACGGDDKTDKVEKAVESVTGSSDAKLKGDSALDTVAYALVKVQSAKYEDYDIDGNTVRLKVRKGITLAGSECVIIESATGNDHPDASFVLVESDGKETKC